MTDLRLVPAAIGAWLACAVAVGLGSGTVGVWAVGLLVAAAVVGPVVVRRGVAVGAWLALVAVAVALGSCAAQLHLRDAGPLADLVAERATVTVTGTVRSETRPVAGRWEESRQRFVLGVERVQGRGRSASAAAQVVVIAEGGAPYGARIDVTGRLTPAEPGDEVVAVLRATGDVTLVSPPGAVDRVVGRIRAALLDVTSGLPPDQRGLVPGLAVGDTSRLPADLGQAMKDVSLTHITAVSGGHFAVLLVTVVGLTAVLRLPRWARAAVTAVTMGGFVLLVHPDPSVVRAGAMGGVAALAMLLGRPARTIPALATGVLGLVVVDPWLARSTGFILSVVATAGITLLAPVIAGWLSALPRRAALALAVPAAAQAVCGPVLVLIDPAVSLYAVPANLLAAPALLPGTVLGVAAAVVAPLWPPVAGLLAHLAGAATWWIATVARTAAALPGARQAWPAGPVGALTLALATVAVLAMVPAVRRWGLRAAAAALVVVVAAGLVPEAGRRLRPWPPAGWELVACDVGQGDALVVRSGPSSAVVVDVGPPGDAAGECLDELGVTTVDLLVLTHFHDDHVGGLGAVLAGRRVTAALVSPLAEPAAEAESSTAALAAEGASVQVGVVGAAGTAGDVTWSVLGAGAAWAGSGDADVNDASLLLLLRTPGLTVVALGDAEEESQSRLAARLVRQPGLIAGGVDVVKVAHHGSANRSDRLTAVLSAAVALVSVGADNDYGHPDAGTLAAYRDTGALVVTTSACGAIAVGRAADGLAVSADCLGRDP